MTIDIKGHKVRIDRADLGLISQYKWHIGSTGYAVWRGMKDGRKQTIRMHRLITDCPKGKVVDHINHDQLDNRKANLRICTQSENGRNRTDQGKGYWLHSQNDNWVVEIWGKHIGCFQSEDEAKRVAALVRSGGTYSKPERTHCKYGHSLVDAYDYGRGKMCRRCQSIKSSNYYRRRIGKSQEQKPAA